MTDPGTPGPTSRPADRRRDPTPGEPHHLAPDDVGDRPLIDLSRDPTPGVPDHAAPEHDRRERGTSPAGRPPVRPP